MFRESCLSRASLTGPTDNYGAEPTRKLKNQLRTLSFRDGLASMEACCWRGEIDKDESYDVAACRSVNCGVVRRSDDRERLDWTGTAVARDGVGPTSLAAAAAEVSCGCWRDAKLSFERTNFDARSRRGATDVGSNETSSSELP